MNDQQLKIIIEIAQCGSFSKAESGCHLSKQAISKQVDALEAELGFTIFDRSFKGVTLTAKGVVFLEGAQQLLDLKQDILRRCEESEPKQDCLRLSSVEYKTLLDDVTVEYKNKYPDVRIVPVVHTNHSTIYRLKHNMIDLGEVSGNFKAMLSDELYYLELTSLPYMCIMRHGHPFSHKKKLNTTELSHKKVLVYKNSIHPALLAQLQKECHNLTIKDSFDQILTDLHEALDEEYIIILANKFIYNYPGVSLAALSTKYRQEFGIAFSNKDNVNVRRYLALAADIFKQE